MIDRLGEATERIGSKRFRMKNGPGIAADLPGIRCDQHAVACLVVRSEDLGEGVEPVALGQERLFILSAVLNYLFILFRFTKMPMKTIINRITTVVGRNKNGYFSLRNSGELR